MFLSKVCVLLISSSLRCMPIICSKGYFNVRTMESWAMTIFVSEQLARETEMIHSWGANCKSGDMAMLGSSVEEMSGTTWLVVTKLSGNVAIPPGGIAVSVLRTKCKLASSK